MTLTKRLATLEARQRDQCARDWQRIGEIFAALPGEILAAFARGDNDKVGPEYDTVLNEARRLYTPVVEAFAISITPAGPVENWTDDELENFSQ